jgi:hypothetical protein
MMVKAVAVGPLDGHRIWVRFDDPDRTSGELDLTPLFALGGMYQPWEDRQVFETVRVSPIGEIVWYTPPVDVDLCPEWAFKEITGREPPDPDLRASRFRRWQNRRRLNWARRYAKKIRAQSADG